MMITPLNAFQRIARGSFLGTLALFAPDAGAFECPDKLGDKIDAFGSPDGYDYDVYYYDDGFLDPDYFSALGAAWVSNALVASHFGFTSFPQSFRAPFWDDDPKKTCIYDSGDTAMANRDRITVDSPKSISEEEPWIRFLVTHENFHHVEYAYGDMDDWPALGSWIVEGTARAMEDRLYLDIDQNPDWSFFVGEVNGYLGSPNSPLFFSSYRSALFWSYAMDRLGTSYPEPAPGVDFMRGLWETVGDGLDQDGVQALRDTIADFDPDLSLEQLFLDFAITNYTHDLDVSALDKPDHYAYFDETPAGGDTPYGAVEREAPMQIGTIQSSSVFQWGSRYIEWDLNPNSSCTVFGVWGAQDSGRELGWAVIGVRNGGRVTELLRARGDEVFRGFLNSPTDPFDAIALVVTGTGQDSNSTFNYAFDLEFSADVDILAPLDQRPEFVGNATNPGRFVVKLHVTGPGLLRPFGLDNPSVKGLDPSTFQVVLRSSSTGVEYPARIINSDYVGGEYWLTVAAPPVDEGADGNTYDLEFSISGDPLCPPAVVTQESVLYAEEVLHQAHVLDRSGSMSEPQPEENSKLTAAKNAVRLYVDAGDYDDSMGIASFSGDDVECNDDADIEFDMVEVPGNRGNLKGAVNGVTAAGLTSIGDGILKGLDLLAAATGPADRRNIALYSDGLENEGDFWRQSNPPCGTPPVRDYFSLGGSAERVEIDTIAFGSDADQNLLQSIADHSGGEFYPVKTDEASGVAASLQAAAAVEDAGLLASALEVPNRLADAYRTIQERAAHADRLFSRADRLNAGQPLGFPIEITEASGGGVTGGVFAFNWHLDAASVSVTLRDVNGNVVSAGNPAGWGVRSDGTHKVYQFSGVLAPGVYNVTVQSDSDVQLMSTLTGRVRRGVDIDLRLSPVRSALPYTPCTAVLFLEPKYLRGLPVKISASLSDIIGGLENLDVVARVVNADNSTNRIVLHDDGSHGDDVPGDGVYTGHYTRTPFASFGGVPDNPPAPPSGEWGSYVVTVAASGTSNFGEPFTRTQMGGFSVFRETTDFCLPDSDDDGLPTRWEERYGLDPFDPTDALLDQDNDGLIALDEFFQGTHPLNPDTDGGGEADGSEVAAGRDPLFERDDALPRLFDFGVVRELIHIPTHRPQPATNIIHFPVNPAYRRMQIWRQAPFQLNFSLLADIDLVANPTGIYYDQGLTNGLLYRYYLVAIGESGAMTPRTATFTATPKADPLAPEGWVSIDKGASAADSLGVLLTLDASSGADEFRVSEDPLFAGAAWLPMTDTTNFVFADPGEDPFPATVYVQYRDAAGNESPIEQASILVDRFGNADGDVRNNANDPDDDGDGLDDEDEILLFGYDPFNPDSDGNGIGDADEDFDRDLYGDLAELQQGTDPLVNLADTDMDGLVSGADYIAFRDAWLAQSPKADVNGDGNVDIDDLTDYRAAFRKQYWFQNN